MSGLNERLLADRAGAGPAGDALAAVRQNAMRQLMQNGFPDLRTEDWKYTPLKLLERRELEQAIPSGARRPEFPIRACVLHFDHGRLPGAPESLPAGVTLEALTDPADLQRDYGGRAGAFAWLNLARFDEGWKLRVSGKVDTPIIIAVTTGEIFRAAVHPRMLVELSPGARLVLLEWQVDEGAGLVNAVTEIRLGAGAALDHAQFRNGRDSVWIQRTDVDVNAGAGYRWWAADFDGRLTRQDHNVALLQADASCRLNGVFIAGGRRHVDYHTCISHVAGQTRSEQNFRGLADGRGVGVFNGRIHIHPGADGSESALNTANLLLSEHATINAKPELEIHAEEVSATHGATVGRLDEAARFYMRSRGIPDTQAALMLKRGFAAAPLDDMPPAGLRERIGHALDEVLSA